MTQFRLARRGLLRAATGAVALLVLPVPLARAASDAPLAPEVEAAVAAVLAGRIPVEAGVGIEVPDRVENGGQVPVTVRIDSPMTEADHVTAIHLIASRNPTPGIGTFHLTPHLARAEVFTRIRLGEEQRLLVLAELSDGRVLAGAARIAVATGGCAT